MPGGLFTTAGPATLGGALCAGVPADGRVFNVTTEDAGLSGANVLFDFEGVNAEEIRVIGYVDGQAVMSAGASSGVLHLPTLADGEHKIELRVQREHFEGAPDTAGDLDGRRAILRWSAVTTSDVRGYKLYADDGAGGSYAVIATLTEIVPDPTFRAAVTSGSGTGTITIGGVFGADAMNAKWRIKVASGATTFQVDPGTGSYGTAQTLTVGVPINIGSGLTVLFNDAAALYIANDTWEVWVGPRREFVTEELEPGTYNFKVSSLDAAGNESSLSSATAIVIDPAPRAPTGLAVTYAGGTFTATFTDPDDADLDVLELYTDFSTDLGECNAFGEVIFDAPVGTCLPGVESITFTPASAPNGTYRFVVRARDTEDRVSKNADAVSVVLPTTSVGIGVPFGATVTPAASGAFVVAWKYDLADDTDPSQPVTHFDVYENTSSSSPSFSSPLSSEAAVITAAGIVEQSFTTGSYSHGAVRYFTVRARNATLSLASVNTDLTAGTADATAPSTPSGLGGLPQ